MPNIQISGEAGLTFSSQEADCFPEGVCGLATIYPSSGRVSDHMLVEDITLMAVRVDSDQARASALRVQS